DRGSHRGGRHARAGSYRLLESRPVLFAPTCARETGRIAERAQEPCCVEGPRGRWMPSLLVWRDISLAPVDLIFESRFPVVRTGMVSHFTQDDDLSSHVIDLGIGEEDAHFRRLLFRHSRQVALRPSTEVQSALKAIAGRRCRQ